MAADDGCRTYVSFHEHGLGITGLAVLAYAEDGSLRPGYTEDGYIDQEKVFTPEELKELLDP